MLFNFKVTTKEGTHQDGSIDAPSLDLAISALQRRGLIVISVEPANKAGFFAEKLMLGRRVSLRETVLLSRQIATLFEAKVSALATFRLLATEVDSPVLRVILTEITDDIKGGTPISGALARHPEVFSDFYVSMVKSGEESGKMSEAFSYLADYLERSYTLVTRTRNALIYPIFVVASFVIVMILMMIFVIPKLSEILKETGGELPIYTRLVIGVSDFFVSYGLILGIVAIAVAIFLLRYAPTPAGRVATSRLKLSIPYFGSLYRKLYLSRIADNLNTMLTSGIPAVKALEITADIVDNEVYKEILLKTTEAVRAGSPMSGALARYEEVPSIMIQMMKVGEETGQMGFVLDTLSRFYNREVNNEIDTIVGLIEPAMIVVLGLGVGVLLTAILVPIYNIASSL